MRLILFLFCFTILACHTPSKIGYARTGEVTCDGHTKQEISVRSVARSSTPSEAILFAERNVMENILFKGIPECNQQIAMISDETTFMNKYRSDYQQFIQSDYVHYITGSETIASDRSGNVSVLTQKVSVDISALRKELENRGWIRKFGF